MGFVSVGVGLLAVALLIANRDRIRTRTKEKSCGGGNVDACLQLAEMYASGSGVTQNVQSAKHFQSKAAEILDRSCRDHDTAACFRLGELLLVSADGTSPARDAFERACNSGSSRACLRAAALMDSGRAPNADERSERNALRAKACHAGDDATCMELASSHIDSDRAKDAAPLLEVACNRRHGVACYELSELYLGKEGLPKDKERAEAFAARAIEPLQRACDQAKSNEGKPSVEAGRACGMLGDLYDAGRGTARDFERVAPLWRTACDAAIETYCERFRVGDGPIDAVLSACEAGNADACFELGDRAKLGLGMTRDVAMATGAYEKAARIRGEQ